MPLQVWLPLTGDLSNNGLHDYSLTIYRGNEVYNANGKLGKCFYSNGVNTIKISNIIPDFYSYTAYSLCAWFYIEAQNTVHTGSAVISSGNWNNQVLNLAVSDWSTDHYTRLRISGTSWSNTYTYNFNLNTWYHVVVSSDGNKTYAYVNGSLIGDTASGFLPSAIEGNDICVGGATYYSGMQFFGKICDVRIYDHALSPKEVKLLSQGLVAHYQLNDAWLEGTTNLASKPDCLSNTCYNGAKGTYGYGTNTDMYKTVGVFEGKLCSKLYMGTSGASARPYPYIANLFVSNGTNAPAYKTLSFDYFSTIGTYINPYKLGSGTATCNWTNPSASPSSGTFTNSGNIPIVTGKWNHITMILHGTTDANAEWGYIIMGDTHTSNTSNYWLFANMQLEEKDHATGYTDGNRSENIVYDSSGFNYHGKINTAMSISSDSARSNISTVFNGTDNAIQIPFNAMLGLTEAAKREYTISVWTYKTSIGTDGYQTILGGPSGFELEARNAAGTDPQYVTWNWGKVVGAYEFNKWEHFCFVHTLSDSKLFVNGVLQGTGSSANVPIGNYFIGAWNTAPQQNFEGKMSDFRIYATALSADDVLALYNAPVSIANNGTMITQGEFVEI